MKHNPLSRASDPSTSHRAEEDYKAAGAQESQAEAILARLQEGPATARDLSALSLKYTSRTSDLRSIGHDIRFEDGRYTLHEKPVQRKFDL